LEAIYLDRFEESLFRCSRNPKFLDRFYELFLASSPKVKEKFANTDFIRQKRALKGSFHLMLLAAENEDKGPDKYLRDIAAQHSRDQLGIGAELYDLWLDSLLSTVKECDDEWTKEIGDAWERVMMVGVHYLLSHYDEPPAFAIVD